MEGNVPNQENNLNGQLEREKNKLGKNAQEVIDIASEKKSFTEQAKLLLARIGKIASVGVKVAGATAILGSLALGIDELVNHSSDTHEYKTKLSEVLEALAFLGGFVAVLGGIAASKFKD